MAKTTHILHKAAVYLLFGFLIISFAAWGVADIFTNIGQNHTIATVGGKEITQSEYTGELNRSLSRLSRLFGQEVSMEQAGAFGLTQQALSSLVRQKLFEIQTEEMGMVVPRTVLQKELLTIEAFQNQSGDFDADRFKNALFQANLGEAEFLDSLSHDLEEQQFEALIRNGIQAPRTLIRLLEAYQKETRDIEVAVVQHDTITLDKKPNDSELATFYEGIKKDFLAPEFRDVSYVAISSSAMADEVVPSREQISEEFQAQKDSLDLPERRDLRQAIFASQEQANAAQERLQKGDDFDKVAKEVSGNESVSLGSLAQAEIFPELREPVFAIAEGEFTAPIKTPFGWHIVLVQAVAPAKDVTLEEVREEITHDAAVRLATEEAILLANQLDDVLGSGANLEETASQMDLEVKTVTSIDPQGLNKEGQPAANITQDRTFLETMLTTQVGEESPLIEREEGEYFVLRVNGLTPPSPRPLAEVKGQVERRWIADQKRQLAETQAEALRTQLKGSVIAKESYRIARNQQDLGGMSAAAVIARAFDEEVSSSFVESQEGISFAVLLKNRNIATERETNAPEFAKSESVESEALRNYNNEYRNSIVRRYLESVEQEVGVKVNTDLISRVVGGR